MQDPDQLSVNAQKTIENTNFEPLTGPVTYSKNKNDLLELESEGLVDNVINLDDGYQGDLTGNGLEMLKAMGLWTKSIKKEESKENQE